MGILYYLEGSLFHYLHLFIHRTMGFIMVFLYVYIMYFAHPTSIALSGFLPLIPSSHQINSLLCFTRTHILTHTQTNRHFEGEAKYVSFWLPWPN